MTTYSNNIDGKLCFFAHDGKVSIKLVSLHDPSAIELFDYDSKCAACWLGTAHSKEYHLQALRKQEEIEDIKMRLGMLF